MVDCSKVDEFEELGAYAIEVAATTSVGSSQMRSALAAVLLSQMPVQGAASEIHDGEKTVSMISLLMVMTTLAVLMGAFWYGHIRGRAAGRKEASKSMKRSKRHIGVQSQVTYQRDLVKPRFTVLPEASHGCSV